MPLRRINYQKSLIYIIKTHGKHFIGCTTNFSSCKYKHKEIIFLTERPNKLYNTIRANDYEWKMEILYKFPCNNKLELLQELDSAIQRLNPELN